MTGDASRWQAVVRRDPDADDAFVFSVRTTGVYCRPTCPARRPNRDNVRFHASIDDARRAGFRPCKRCRPDEASHAESQREAVARACRTICDAKETPNLNALARAAGMSTHHFHRTFQRIIGVTPKQYAAECRSRRLQENLLRTDTVTDAIYDAGFNSSGRFYESSNERLGMTPKAFRSGGRGMTIRFAVGETSLGSVLVAATAKGICAVFLGDDPDALARDLQDRFPNAEITAGDKGFERWVARVVGMVEHPAAGLDLPLDIRGTAFQIRVWDALRRIPPGSTASYAEIAKLIGRPSASRAVASACAANPIAIAIPCHRVVRTDESLSGYRWGVERKAELLKREQC